MQLVAYGAQDIYLTGNPQITFFKVVYRRHTNFSMECIRQTFNGTVGNLGSVTATISRNGDLVYKLYVTSDTADVTNGLGIVSDAELEIGGQRIDRHYLEWNQIWNELSTDESKAIGLKSMVGCVGTNGTGATTGVGKIQVPLNFWFCRNPGLALPLIALQYHEVKVKITLGGDGTGADGAELWADYIYLDTDERRRFAQVSHEYLIEQVQRQSLTNTRINKLNFNHPVKELIWTSTVDYDRAHIKLNGHDRFALQEPEYFQLRQPYDYHTAVPKQNLPAAAQLTTLDRQTQFETLGATSAAAPALSATLTEVAADTDVSSNGLFDFTDSTLTFQIDAAGDGNVTRGAAGTQQLVSGDQLALVITGDSSSPGADGQFTAGLIYFATLTSTPTVASTIVTFNITPPTSADETALVLGNTANVQGTLRIFAVSNGNSAQARTSQMVDNINVYSFALKPEEHQPSGTCNFSRIDNAQLVCEGSPTFGHMYAVNYNVLRIMSGMGGLAYSN